MRGYGRVEGCWLHASADVRRLEAFRPLEEIELDLFALVQGAIAVFLDGGEMDEHVLPGGPLNEAVSFGSIKPFHCTLLSHNSTPFASAQVSNPPAAGPAPSLLQAVAPSNGLSTRYCP